ncbi:MAG: TolC family outer membrane protein, partial [Alphaproteobacteria bacterium]
MMTWHGRLRREPVPVCTAGRSGVASRVATLAALVCLGAAAPAGAQTTLTDALALAYATNPRLEAERARLRATDEELPQALSNWRPTVTVNSDIGKEYVDNNPPDASGNSDTTTPRAVDLTVSQPLFRGFRTQAETRRAQDNIAAGRADLISIEQDVLFDAVEGFSNVLRERAVLDLQRNNERVLAEQLQATRDRFEVGEVTRTDVAQAESRLSRATSDRIGAENDLETAEAQYKNIIGAEPVELVVPAQPDILPGTLTDVIRGALTNNPDVVSAEFRERSAREDVELVRGELLPEVTLDGQLERSEDRISKNFERDVASVTVNLRVPLYQSGSVFSRVREAKQVASQRLQELADTRREAERAATDAWESLQASEATVVAFQSEVRAQELALEGVKQEQLVGARTVLDVLDAE